MLEVKLKITGMISLVDVQLSFHMSKDVLRIVPDVFEEWVLSHSFNFVKRCSECIFDIKLFYELIGKKFYND